LILTY